MIIKEYCKLTNGKVRFIIRESNYGSNLDKFERLFNVAQNDFPNLESSDIEVIHYGGQRYKKTFGIEFYTGSYIPNNYNEVSTLGYTL